MIAQPYAPRRFRRKGCGQAFGRFLLGFDEGAQPLRGGRTRARCDLIETGSCTIGSPRHLGQSGFLDVERLRRRD